MARKGHVKNFSLVPNQTAASPILVCDKMMLHLSTSAAREQGCM